jgi:hypothetical protein
MPNAASAKVEAAFHLEVEEISIGGLRSVRHIMAYLLPTDERPQISTEVSDFGEHAYPMIALFVRQH